MVNNRPLGVAVVGLGIGEQHARAFHASRYCCIRWLYDLDPGRARTLAEQLGVGEVAPDFDTILDAPDTHIVSIASYDDAHFEQALRALAAGKHVFVEKPLCQTWEQLQQLKRAWVQHAGQVKFACNFVLRAAPLYQWVRQQVQAGIFGNLYAFDGDYLYGRLNKITEGWRQNVENYSVMQGGGIHLIDLLLWIAGQRPLVVSAAGNRISTRGTRFRYSDFVAATLRTESGLVVRLTANFGCVHRHQHVLRLFGTEATFIYDDVGARFCATRGPAVAATPVTLAALPATKGDLIPEFILAVIENRDISAETQLMFDGFSISLACDKALETGAVEEVTYI